MSPRGTILVVDDESYVRESLAAMLEGRGFRVRTAGSVAEALQPARLAGADAVLTDLKMPGEDGVALVGKLAAEQPELPIVVLTAYGNVRSAVDCMQAGAADFLLKPTDPDELTLVLDRALAQTGLKRELTYLRSRAGAIPAPAAPLGVSAAWQRILELVDVAAPTNTSVLLLGESGTGKEEVARLLHARSQRAGGPFVPVNCAAIPAELFESEFFGHRRGAFTGAVADRDGRFRIAHRGTLLLDEIDALPPVAQAKVLRVLQDGTFERVGESEATYVDVRLVCASNTDLGGQVESGAFRPDLFYRINVLPIAIPPLRQRRDDIPVLAEAFLVEFAARLGKPVTAIAPEAMGTLVAYDWPGNVRELRNVIERGVLLARGEALGVDGLPFVGEVARTGGRQREGQTLRLREALAEEEKRLLEEALRRSDGVRREAAQLLGIDERNMAYYLRKHGLMERPRRP